ncbi:MAG: hypothetical protein K2Y16_05950 [Burkholderiales bacterium]|nr:hypothetical protein [Burkholderiales bacterium]
MQQHWLTRPDTIRKLWRVFIAVLAVTVAAEFFIEHEAHFGIDGAFGFNAWYGFTTCAAMIVVAKLIGLVLKRPDTYYGERDD